MDLAGGLRLGMFLMVLLDGFFRRWIFELWCWLDCVWGYARWVVFGIVYDGFDRWIAFGIIYGGLRLGLFMMDLIDGLCLGLFLMDLIDGCVRRLRF
jgi:hypothetical protein